MKRLSAIKINRAVASSTPTQDKTMCRLPGWNALFPIVTATVLCLLCLAIGRFYDLGPTDDAFITYRHVKNFINGQGLVYNPGERVEATTNFLFAIILGILGFARIEPLDGARLLNISSLWLILYLIVQNGRRSLSPRISGARYWITGAVLLGLCPSVTYYMWMGLETMFFTALLFFGCIVFLNHGEKQSGLFGTGVLLGLAAITRMEAVSILPLIVFFLAVRRNVRGVLPLLAGFTLLFIPVLYFRWSYYGFPFPNTYYAKVHGGGIDLAIRGAKYLGGFALMYAGPVLVVIASIVRFFAVPKDRFRTGFLLAVIGVLCGSAVYVGGDFFPFFRFLLPVLPIVAVLFTDLVALGVTNPRMPIGIDQAPERKTIASPGSMPFWVAIIFAIAASGVALLQYRHITLTNSQMNSVAKRSLVGKLLHANTPRDATLLLGAAGAIPYYSNLISHDVFGLTDPGVAHKKIALGKGKAGHEKVDTLNQIQRLKPDLLLFSSWWNHNADVQTSLRREVHFYLLVWFSLRQLGMPTDSYVPMRLRGPLLTAMIAVQKEMVPKLGYMFQPIGAPRLSSLQTAHTLDIPRNTTPRMLAWNSTQNQPLAKEFPREPQRSPPMLSTKLSMEISNRMSVPRWQARHFAPSFFAFGCHIDGFPNLPCMCTHLMSPFSMDATFASSDFPATPSPFSRGQMDYNLNNFNTIVDLPKFFVIE